ncbi:hypothetical protein [Tenacibaculum piscium]|uniref:hypothetical protein n=1 Tax=Tenacibaculum piscium TaxID=1458515 RepID=UPI001F218BF8|nr:hypothetical protein [Tenacibaculum piscium]
MTAKEKIRQYLVFKGINMSKFSREIGVSNRFLATNGTIMSDKIKIIRNIFPDLNIDWLLFDEGEMLVSEKAEKAEKSENTEIEIENKELKAENKELNKEVRELNRENRELNTEIRNLNNEIIELTTGKSKKVG